MSYLQLGTFSRIRIIASIPRESKRFNTDGRGVCSSDWFMHSELGFFACSLISGFKHNAVTLKQPQVFESWTLFGSHGGDYVDKYTTFGKI